MSSNRVTVTASSGTPGDNRNTETGNSVTDTNTAGGPPPSRNTAEGVTALIAAEAAVEP